MTATRTEKPTETVEVMVETGTYEGGWKFAASVEVEAESNEQLFAVARHVWDESYTNLQGCSRRLTVCREVIRDEDGNVTADGVIHRTESRP